MKWINYLFKRKKLVSRVETFCGSRYDISRCYERLVDKEKIKITSVSVTRVDSGGSRGYVDEYFIAVSYDLHL